ncbi:polysaccharide deacetylase family protein [Halalkalibacter urbisdiaboli]|uniref:polysaccharide deacetylase family protein n=1 Tax=Halalkalibacter urbisdiaboli TaxID=1960589 RepID=UPI000B44DEFA|nr:polysaccharide deacetylase family protein [Halalkalibacter urbisdiaboli]
MTKYFTSVLLLLTLLTGCGNNQAEEPVIKEQPVIETEENNEKVKNDPIEKIESNEQDEQDNKGQPMYRINTSNWKIESLVDKDEKIVLLTIDDAPDTYSVEMAETLKQLDVEAIFFVNGHFLNAEGKEKLIAIHEMGFEIGNHTMNHSNLKELSKEQQTREIVELNDLIETVIGERPRFFRAPFGVNTDHSKQIVKNEGMTLMNWTYGYDWEKDYRDSAALADIMVSTPYLTDGANLLMHDREWTNRALESIVKGLNEKGFTIARPSLIE